MERKKLRTAVLTLTLAAALSATAYADTTATGEHGTAGSNISGTDLPAPKEHPAAAQEPALQAAAEQRPKPNLPTAARIWGGWDFLVWQVSSVSATRTKTGITATTIPLM